MCLPTSQCTPSSAPARGRELRLSPASVPSGRWLGSGNKRSPTPRSIHGTLDVSRVISYLSFAHTRRRGGLRTGAGRQREAAAGGREQAPARGAQGAHGAREGAAVCQTGEREREIERERKALQFARQVCEEEPRGLFAFRSSTREDDRIHSPTTAVKKVTES
jgi:hypothetical protein